MRQRKRLGDLLVEAGLLTEEQLATTLSNKSANEKIGDALLREGFITEQQLIEVLEFQLGIPHINLYKYAIEEDAVKLVPKELARRHLLMPVRIDGNKLLVAMADPMDYFAIEELRMTTGYEIVPGIASKASLYRTINKYYEIPESIEELMGNVIQEEVTEEADIIDEEAPIVRLVNQMITNAVIQKASDIHFDPQETEIRVRYRIDGILRTERTLPKYMQNMITARIKIMSNLNITENRLPQDGRFNMNVHARPIDIRVSVLPTIYGEKIVMRLLDLDNTLDDIDKLGFTPENLSKFQQMIEKPIGIVLITGPTGSGKTSTLYAALNRLNRETVNIITIEDPVEYQIPGIIQVEVKEEVGMSFANSLRSILRQDPDIIMVGEIRDTETAQIAIRASLTGHLVLSTLHTNSAVATIVRLIDMGVEPFLISSSLNGIVAQRLVRKVCRDCGENHEPTEREKEIFAQANIPIHFIRRGRGCTSCGMTGYRGRLAIHEVLLLDETLRNLITDSRSRADFLKHTKQIGMKTLIEDGLNKVAQGLTTTEEVLRVASLE